LIQNQNSDDRISQIVERTSRNIRGR